jgi:hypothetical protein
MKFFLTAAIFHLITTATATTQEAAILSSRSSNVCTTYHSGQAYDTFISAGSDLSAAPGRVSRIPATEATIQCF